jgi:hypothetical protein
MEIITNSGGMPFWLFDPQISVSLFNNAITAVIVVTLIVLAYAVLHLLLSDSVDDQLTETISLPENKTIKNRACGSNVELSDVDYFKGWVIHET